MRRRSIGLPAHATRGTDGARDRRRERHRRGHRAAPGGRGRARRDRRPGLERRARSPARSTASRSSWTSTDVASVGAAVAAVAAELGPIDVLVNNAGTDRFAFFVNTDEELWDFVLGVNLRGVLAVTHAVLPAMHERGGGVDRQRRQRGRPRRLAGLGRPTRPRRPA